VLEDVSLSADFLNRYPDQLSGGERQRAAIARALAAEPDLLVCDEVSSALDVSVQAMIIEMLRRLQAEHRLAMLFITHNLALVRGMAQSVVVLSQGRIVEEGPVEQVFEHPRDPYTIRLMSDAPRLSPAAATGSGQMPEFRADRATER
jgi:peptide/nickel transport system ATP-binding protein